MRRDLLCFAFALFVGCSHPPATIPFGRKGDQHFTGATGKADLLARQLLPRSELPPEGYAAYCYLLFADRAADTEAARRAAALAALRLLSDVSEVRDLPNLKPADLALLLIPVRAVEGARQVLREGDVDVLLAAYDSDRAKRLHGRLERTGHRVPRVAIIGSRMPLESLEKIDPADVFVVDLHVSEAAKVDERLRRLESDLRAGVRPQPGGEPVVLRMMRQFFTLLGYALADAEKVATAIVP